MRRSRELAGVRCAAVALGGSGLRPPVVPQARKVMSQPTFSMTF